MKPFEIIKDIFIVGGLEITNSRGGCIYLMNLGQLILIDIGASWGVDTPPLENEDSILAAASCYQIIYHLISSHTATNTAWNNIGLSKK